MSRQSLLLGIALAASALTALVGGAYASPEAGIDALIRPRFGVLLDPPLHRHHYDCCRGGGTRVVYVPVPYWSHSEQSETVDCGDPNGGRTPLADALDRLADNGVLYIRGNTEACHESLEIRRPVTIAGEQSSAFSAGPDFKRPTISPPDGAPCIIIDRGVPRVEIRDLMLASAHGGNEACIEAWGGALALTNTSITYAGEGSAVYVKDVNLKVVESAITSNSYDPAVVAEASFVKISRTSINSSSTGFELTPQTGSTSLIAWSNIISQSATPGASAQTGLLVHISRGGGAKLEMAHSRVVGFDTGLWFQPGVVPDLDSVKVIHSRVAVTSEAAGLTLNNSLLEGSRSAVYVMRGQATIRNNTMFGFGGLGIDFEPPPVDLKESENLMFPAGGCRKYYMTSDICGCPEDLPPGLDGDDGPGVIGWAGLPEEHHAEHGEHGGYGEYDHTHVIGLRLSAVLFWRAGHDDKHDELGCRRYHNSDHHYLWPR